MRFRRTFPVVVLLLCLCAAVNRERRSLFDGSSAPASDRPATHSNSVQDADFAFRYESKWCGFEVIDAFNGTYHVNGMAAPIPMKLTDDEKAVIFRAVIASGFFDFSRNMNQPEKAELAAHTYELAVRNVSSHAVLWRTHSRWTGADYDLMNLRATILRVVHARPEVARARPRGCGC